MKILLNVQWGKRHLSWRGLVCPNGVVEAHRMLELASKIAARAEEMGHLAIVLSYGTMSERARWANKYKFDVAVGLTLTKTYPSLFYSNKYAERGVGEEFLTELGEYLTDNRTFVTDRKYMVYPLRSKSSKLALISFFNPDRIRCAFVISPYSCETEQEFSEMFFVGAFVSALEIMVPRLFVGKEAEESSEETSEEVQNVS